MENIDWKTNEHVESPKTFEERYIMIDDNSSIHMFVDDITYRENRDDNFEWTVSLTNYFSSFLIGVGPCSSYEDGKEKAKECLNDFAAKITKNNI